MVDAGDVGDVGHGAELALQRVLVVVSVGDVADRVDQVDVEAEGRDEDEGEPVEQLQPLLDQSGGVANVDKPEQEFLPRASRYDSFKELFMTSKSIVIIYQFILSIFVFIF